jgi:hypothetical protein
MNDDDIGFWQGLLLAVILGIGFYCAVVLCLSY